MGKRVDTPMEIYNRGKRIVELSEKYSAFLSMAKDEDKAKLREKVTTLNNAKDEIKSELYEEAKEKSGLDYSKKDKNPELLRKKYTEQLADLKKRKHELRLEKIRIEKYNEQKKGQIKEQFSIAREKYKQMLDMGKITEELYNSRIENMKSAELKDRLALSDNLFAVKEEADRLDSEIGNVKKNIEELDKKEAIYNEYGDVYYRLFGEVLADRNKLDIPKENIDTKTEKVNKKDNENLDDKNNVSKKVDPAEKTNANISKESTTSKDNIPEKVQTTPNANINTDSNANTNSNTNVNNLVNDEQETTENEKTEPDVVVTSKIMFNELYKKMKKGIITDKEINALADVLSNPDNYDKYDITTGLVFNKSKKILKFQGARTARNIERFLRENSKFNDSIRFDGSIEKDNVLSHDILNSWKDIDEKLTYTDSIFSVEKYIEKIEKYKEAGNSLTKEQEDILKKAVDIKNNLISYRKAVNVNDDVTTSRNKRDRNSIFYINFKDRHKNKANRALPETASRENNPGFVVFERENSLDLADLTNREPAPEEARDSETVNRDKSKDRDRVK